MKSKLLVLAGVGLVVAATSASRLAAQPDATSVPTFNRDVAPLIFDKCVTCHRPHQIAPMSLMSYSEVRPWARAIKQKIMKREMPPWFPDPRFGEFKNDRRLTDQQIQTIAAWADGGAPEGSGPLTAKAPPSNDGWSHPSGRPPDLIVEMAEPYEGKATGELPWFNIYQELPAELKKKEHFIEAIELMPGEIEAVHHMVFGIKPIPPGTKIGRGEAWPGGQVINGALLDVETGKLAKVVRQEAGVIRVARSTPASATDSLNEDERGEGRPATEFNYCCYLPGSTFQQYPPGGYMRLPKDGMLEWGVHYTMTGRPFADRSRVGFWFAKDPMFEVISNVGSKRSQIVEGKELVDSQETPVVTAGAAANGPAVPVIPPMTKDWAITAITAYPDDITLYTLYPHMHLRGHEMHYVLTYPDGREQVLLSVPHYDFNWQIFYTLKEPLKVPAGSTLKTVGSYDNSPSNKWASEPQKEVYWSEQSWDEMYNGFRVYSVDKLERKAPASPSTALQRAPAAVVEQR
jgi:hypothetical protein